MSHLFESANQALATSAFRQEILAAAFGNSTPELEIKLVSQLHRDDKMLHHCLDHFENINFSLSHYLAVATQQYRAVEKIKNCLFANTKKTLRLLDFACGYGRLQRLMCLQAPPECLWASDINNTALDYVVNTFGVTRIASSANPENFITTEKFEVIWVASLFSHLPQHLCEAWLERLSQYLTPDGILCFSVHDERLLPDTCSLPSSGFYYLAQSEDTTLDTSIYGTAYVSEQYIADAVKKLSAANFDYHRIAKGLAYEQDLYIVARQGQHNLALLKNIRQGVWGFVDKVFAENDQLYLYGWAASIDDGTIAHIEIKLNGHIHMCQANLLREDVVAVLQDPRFLHSGWEISLPLASAPNTNFVAVTVVSLQGERSLIYLGFINEGRFFSEKT
jgi:2-polyprenyl-3-methyl-5-hydroxy-6-metoxy-1,4-benzoquinol methylase